MQQDNLGRRRLMVGMGAAAAGFAGIGWQQSRRLASCPRHGLDGWTLRHRWQQSRRQDQLTLHADRGSSMKSKVVALLLSDLGVTKTHSRPHVDDNP